MQVYKGLKIFTNKITHTKKQGVRHYLLDSLIVVKLSQILTLQLKIFTQRVSIIVGGSNSYIEKLMEDPVFMFKYKYDTSFIWIDVIFVIVLCINQDIIMHLAKNFSYIIFLILFLVIKSMFH
ncbi:hypothetical protein H5410_021533 [Solanum commersonii]|uniref:Transmembrane protein n=1 Tax=Solanum commersonii TaxID=4109 RepID=A0A9J5ZFE1_SOLCO|nr:hypothetical protein H5410_021533 [Solanum commersonii]